MSIRTDHYWGVVPLNDYKHWNIISSNLNDSQSQGSSVCDSVKQVDEDTN